MKLLVDEDSQARRLLDAPRHAGHDVLSVAELGCNGLPDAQVFAQAQAQGRTLLTHNVADFPGAGAAGRRAASRGTAGAGPVPHPQPLALMGSNFMPVRLRPHGALLRWKSEFKKHSIQRPLDERQRPISY